MPPNTQLPDKVNMIETTEEETEAPKNETEEIKAGEEKKVKTEKKKKEEKKKTHKKKKASKIYQ